MRSMIAMQQEWGWMPKWKLFGRETWTMEGDLSIPVITDTWLKGLRNYDIEAAYQAFRRSATLPGDSNASRLGVVKLGAGEADVRHVARELVELLR